MFKMIPDNVNIDFIGKRFIAFFVSAVLLIGSVVTLSTQGLNFGIDFTGGTLIEIRTPSDPNLGQMRKELNNLDLGSVLIQEFGATRDLLIRLPQQSGDSESQQAAIEKIREAIDNIFAEQAGEEVEYRRVEFVGPQVGEELKEAGLFAVLLSLGGILIYIALRFEWQFGMAAIIALAHDAIATVGLFSITGMEFNLSTLAAILMIAGYSINDTVVVFDRIRENLRKYKKMPLVDLFNKSVNEMLSRTLMTSLTTLLALFALWLFGGEVIRGFVDALLFGIIIGTYSSVFVAAPILLYMGIKRSSFDDEESNKRKITEPDGRSGI